MRSHWRFALAIALLGGTAILLYARSGTEVIVPYAPLSSFPRTLDGRNSVDIPLAPDVLQVLGPGEFLLRDYQDTASRTNLFLFIAYFASQRTGDTIHSPKNCLPGAGWAPVRADRIVVTAPGHAPFRVNRYLISKGDERQLVLYWYWAHNRAVASEYAAKFYLVADSIRMHRSDGSLIRVSMPIAPGQSVDSAQNTLLSFTTDLVPLINRYIPR